MQKSGSDPDLVELDPGAADHLAPLAVLVADERGVLLGRVAGRLDALRDEGTATIESNAKRVALFAQSPSMFAILAPSPRQNTASCAFGLSEP